MKKSSQILGAPTGVALNRAGSVIFCAPGARFRMRWRNMEHLWEIESERLYDVAGEEFVWARPIAFWLDGQRQARTHAPLVCHLHYLRQHAVITTDDADSQNTQALQ